ncbi:MAG: deoxyribonuclease IV [Armatimonadetes bacterium]|nr:deoxyribonuclease IV [Armatimonadota bacterium]
MRFGVHIRIERGLLPALDRASELKCESIQLFSGNPRSWARPSLDHELASLFSTRAAELDIHPVILHTPYLVNLASPDQAIWIRSRDLLTDAVQRAATLGADRVVTHIGSHKGEGWEKGAIRVVDAVRFALDTVSDVIVVLELGAGSGGSVGSRFDELARIIDKLDGHPRVGIAIDTAHLYAVGYDISRAEGVDEMFEDMRRLVGLDRLKLVHLNDTRVELGSHQDRHYHIGRGNIGNEGFRAIVNFPGTEDLPGIIETPYEPGWDEKNLALLRKLASLQTRRTKTRKNA